MTQATLDLDGKALRDQGVARVDSHTPEEWKNQMQACIRTYAKTAQEFTAEDVLTIVGRPNNPNAIGAQFLGAVRSGIIKKVGYRTARRKQRHAGQVAVYIGDRP
jgi:hypothetical protein